MADRKMLHSFIGTEGKLYSYDGIPCLPGINVKLLEITDGVMVFKVIYTDLDYIPANSTLIATTATYVVAEKQEDWA